MRNLAVIIKYQLWLSDMQCLAFQHVPWVKALNCASKFGI